ncbi:MULTISPECIES: acetyl-CoA carboxylase biotin carboxyl carrier protein subunit [Bacillaceae]|jgi:acetyl-CoA carboxylase biotin carboxyl carrier protein|uniref:Acetyl-CoA carboxylase biotin carboxyl carrier protein subunit n=1 Tax=Sutcliffiella horikoshii TaxID=79883 RepID=A0A5D4T750_9BACI|nr:MULTISPECIES: acetyl-CoA carboxylase biotin carboxyl carrier protein subunit [Bacillaceae]MEA3318817.1 acetyl-CoA carboxylase biotin carboxyl carrier protein subunit [Bacillota bacterium]NLP50856.1 acetyl-CoA carboxylase biotin carboxyl carrier protein subunit [Bacillus sp. RO1]NMH72272.1 acetyl-CoA carboxylase biotin carboxyl carrier protein subunit [Bacillus sp. RO2]TYS70701.1 acetyl-CoA carboxylase biotin carboxyl carrier protein subunit [Sutcliffiella horikoshii]
MKKVEAAMAGTVWKVLVEVGDEVTAGQTVIILESMKMEIPVEVMMNGKVASISTAEGEFVNDGDVLLELE